MSQHRRTSTTGLLLTLLLVAHAGACRQQKQPTKITPPDAKRYVTTTNGLAKPRNDIPGLRNLARVDKGLWRSYQPRRRGFEQLKKLGVKTVVSLRMTRSDRKYLEGLGLRYRRIPITPWKANEARLLEVLKIITDPRNQPVHVHCKHGADRTGLVIALYRVVVQGWSKDRALRELSRFGFHSVWKNLKRTLERIDVAAFRKRLAAAPIQTPPLVR
jgi:protein tyrosine phosphatase (PTP) superfamily phosphohydrolase (DUF442 family)